MLPRITFILVLVALSLCCAAVPLPVGVSKKISRLEATLIPWVVRSWKFQPNSLCSKSKSYFELESKGYML